jgi:hypothetical protein
MLPFRQAVLGRSTPSREGSGIYKVYGPCQKLQNPLIFGVHIRNAFLKGRIAISTKGVLRRRPLPFSP